MANICHSAIASSWYASYLSEIIIVHDGSMFGNFLGVPFTHKFTFPQMHIKNLTNIIGKHKPVTHWIFRQTSKISIIHVH